MIWRDVRWASVGAAVCLSLVGCAQAPAKFAYSHAPEQSVVFPQAPEIPRFRFLGELTGDENFIRDKDQDENIGIKALRWVVGLVAGKRQPVILQRPQAGLVSVDGRIYVTDVSRQGIGVFDPLQGKFTFWEDAAENIGFRSPISIIDGPRDELWVTDSAHRLIVRLSRDGKPLGVVGAAELVQPTGMARDPQRGRIYVADTREHQIKVFDDDGNFLKAIGKQGEAPGEFNSPTHLYFRDDTLLVADTMNSRVQLLNPEGELIRVFGERGLFVGNLPRPKGVAADENGLIYVVESYFDHLLVFDNKGQFLLPIGGTGKGVGQFYLPAGVWTDAQNRVYVADMFNGRVVVFEFLGEGHEQGS